MAGREEASDELLRELASAGPERLLELVRERLGELGFKAVCRVLRNPHCPAEVIEAILGTPRLMAVYEVRREVTRHPRTPQVQALRHLPGLFWRDMLEVGRDTRVPPQVRRAANLRLGEQLSSLSVGEKMAIARKASPELLVQVRRDASPKVIGAMLENPRLTESALLPLASRESAPPAVLAVIARSRRWSLRYRVRVAVARNPSTPSQLVVALLPRLKRTDLRAVAADPRLAFPVRYRARRLLAEEE